MIKRILACAFGLVFCQSGWSSESFRAFDQCASNPGFIKLAKMQHPVAIDTQQSLLPGIVFRELQGARRMYRHPSWEQSGHIGSTARDEQGNLYASPIPSIDLETNPLEKRNNIYKVNSKTGKMDVFIKLPAQVASSQRNPFGAMGLAYDCSKKNLYAASIANSTPRNIAGSIYQISVENGEVLSQIDNVDAIGIGLFDTGSGKRLYYGDARSSSVFSVALNSSGGFNPDVKPRHEFSLLSIKNGNSTQVRKIRFEPHEEFGFVLTATDTEFAFRLLTDTSKRFRHYQFRWLASWNSWEFYKIK